MKRHTIAGAVALLVCGIVPSLSAGWVAVNLHPADASESWAAAVSGLYQAGRVSDATQQVALHPALWQGSALGYTRISGPSGGIAGIDGFDKVGAWGGRFAALWKGASNTLVDLHPAVATVSQALAVLQGVQVGSVFVSPGQPLSPGYHAAMWGGTSASFQDMNPAGAVYSVLSAIDWSGQAGGFQPSPAEGGHAALWQGTAESVVDLHPSGAYASQAQAISNGRQGGYVQYARDGPAHAALWTGTPESYVDLTPSFVWTAGINGMDAGIQVGVGVPLGSTSDFHALVWVGTADSCLDLHAFLSSDYTKSEARAVDIDEFGTIRVVGYAYNNNYYLPNGTYYPRNEAMMWVLVPEPSSLVALAAGLAALAKFRWRR